MTVRARTVAVIASCDQEEFIGESIESVASEVDHVVVVDDASIDGSVARIRAAQADNVTLIELSTRVGVSQALTIAVQAANEDVLLFQGGDDLSFPGRAAAHVAALNDPGVAISTAQPVIIGPDGGTLPDAVALEFSAPHPDVDPLAHLFFHGNFVCAPSVAVRREDYLRWGGFSRNVDLLQDYMLWMRALSEGRLDWVSDPVIAYRKHSRNASRSYTGLDSPRRRRHAAELEYVLTSFIERASDQVLNRLCAAAGISHAARGGIHSDAVRALVLVSHPHRVAQRRGMHLLFEVAREPVGDEILREFGLTRADFDTLAQVIDHENTGDVRRAVTVGALLSSAYSYDSQS